MTNMCVTSGKTSGVQERGIGPRAKKRNTKKSGRKRRGRRIKGRGNRRQYGYKEYIGKMRSIFNDMNHKLEEASQERNHMRQEIEKSVGRSWSIV